MKMDEFLKQVADIFETDTVKPDDKLTSFDAWDSLTQLMIIALADEKYGVTISAKELKESETIEGIKKLIDKKKA